MKLQSVFDESFRPYGKVVEGYDFEALLQALALTPCPSDGTVYQPSEPAMEALPVFQQLQDRMYGGMPIQIGYCNGHNQRLNCLEYHRDSEVNVAGDEMVLLVSSLQTVQEGHLDTREVEAFVVPAGTAVQLYETTLHYAPATAPGGKGFRVVIVLPRGTNTDLPQGLECHNLEDRLLRARNKWLIAHPEAPEAAQGAFVGLTGENPTVE